MQQSKLFFSPIIHRPILQGLHDLQQDPPAAWCIGCGMEVYEPGCLLCPECRKESENETPKC